MSAPSVRRTLAALAALAAVAGAGAATAETIHALVIGVDHYRHVGSLRGAVNDAKDLSAALRSVGAADVTVLLDDQATRDSILRSWKTMLERTKPGDRVILTFSGHGSTELLPQAERSKNSNNTVILLGGFNVSGPGARERIYSKEIHTWLKDAEARGAEVMVVMDSCHSGGMARAIDGRADAGAARGVPSYTMPADQDVRIDLPDSAPEAAGTASDDLHDLPRTTFLAGAQITEKVYEVNVPGPDGTPVRRGPLSVAVARALRGDAGADDGGALSRSRLFQFVRTQVRGLSEARHSPNLLPARGLERIVLPTAAATAPATGSDAVRVALIGVGAAEATAMLAKLKGVVPAASRAEADLIWDGATRQVVTGQGDLAAWEVDGGGVQGAVEKARFLRLVRELGRNGGLDLAALPNDLEHHRGEAAGFELRRRPHPYLLVFNVSGDGSIQLQYPLARDSASIPVDKAFRLDFTAVPPFGADHLIAISSPVPLDGLRRELAALDGTRDLPALAGKLRGELDGKPYALGVQGLFTVP